MNIAETTFHDVFEFVQQVASAHPGMPSLDPIADLKTSTKFSIPYSRKPKQNASSAFMTIKKSPKNWIGLLLRELENCVTGAQADITIMHGNASAKSSVKKAAQTWYQFVTELYDDKIAHRNDISESQARQLSRLVDEMSASGFKLKGCGTLEFIDETGKVLS